MELLSTPEKIALLCTLVGLGLIYTPIFGFSQVSEDWQKKHTGISACCVIAGFAIVFLGWIGAGIWDYILRLIG